jgi:hypothetical protein
MTEASTLVHLGVCWGSYKNNELRGGGIAGQEPTRLQRGRSGDPHQGGVVGGVARALHRLRPVSRGRLRRVFRQKGFPRGALLGLPRPASSTAVIRLRPAPRVVRILTNTRVEAAQPSPTLKKEREISIGPSSGRAPPPAGTSQLLSRREPRCSTGADVRIIRSFECRAASPPRVSDRALRRVSENGPGARKRLRTRKAGGGSWSGLLSWKVGVDQLPSRSGPNHPQPPRH